MSDSLTVRVFEWQGRVHVTFDRVEPTPDRRVAHRTRVWSRSWTTNGPVRPAEAVAMLSVASQELAAQLRMRPSA